MSLKNIEYKLPEGVYEIFASRDNSCDNWFNSELSSIHRSEEIKKEGFSNEVLENIKKSWSGSVELPKK